MQSKKELDRRKPREITRHNISDLISEMGEVSLETLFEAQFTPIVHAYLYNNIETMLGYPEIKIGSRRERPHLISLKPMGSRVMSWVNGRDSIDINNTTVDQQTFDFKYRYDYTKIIDRTSYSREGLVIGILTGHPLLGAFIGDNTGTTTYLTERHEVHIHTPGLILESKNKPPIGIVPIPTRYGPIKQDSWRHFDTWKYPNYERGLVEDWDRTPEKADYDYQNLLFSLFKLAQEQKMPLNIVSDWLNISNSVL